MSKTLNVKLQLRNDIAENWEKLNPVLAKGEIGIESDTGKFKIGEGKSEKSWNSLSYATQTVEEIETNLGGIVEQVDALRNFTTSNFVPLASKGVANGIATLDDSGKVPSTQLPSYVDDVLEYTNQSSFPATGESGKIYVDLSTNKTYRWGGTAYVQISESLALGETSSTAYRGDRGKVAYDTSQANATAITSHVGSKSNPHSVTKAQVGLGNVTNESKTTMFTSPTFTGTVTLPTSTKIGTLTTTGLVKYVNGTLSVDASKYVTSGAYNKDANEIELYSGSTSTSVNSIPIPLASSLDYGLVKVTGAITDTNIGTQALTSVSNRFYGVISLSDGKLAVNVPWANTTYTSGNGITFTGTTISVATKVITTDDILILDGGSAGDNY